jgi:hypothetical protein
MRWNVVIGGQLFSKSLRGFMDYKMEFAGHEGWFMALVLILLPFVILGYLVKYFLPNEDTMKIKQAKPTATRVKRSPKTA